MEGDVLEEAGFVLKENHPRSFHMGENEFLPNALGGSDGCLTIELEVLALFLEYADSVVVVVLNRGVLGIE